MSSVRDGSSIRHITLHLIYMSDNVFTVDKKSVNINWKVLLELFEGQIRETVHQMMVSPIEPCSTEDFSCSVSLNL